MFENILYYPNLKRRPEIFSVQSPGLCNSHPIIVCALKKIRLRLKFSGYKTKQNVEK